MSPDRRCSTTPHDPCRRGAARDWLLASVAVVAVLGAGVYFWTAEDEPASGLPSGTEEPEEVAKSDDPDVLGSPQADSGAAPVEDRAIRSASTETEPAEPSSEDEPANRDIDVGRLPIVPADHNPQLALAAAAARSGEQPERVSVFHQPTAYDPGMSEAERSAWVATPEPGRVFEPAQPGEDVPAIALEGPGVLEVTQGETCQLAARVPAGEPCTFTSFDNGHFSNKLTTITVLAGDDGVARADFHVSAGVYGACNILAASPVCAGRVGYTVQIDLPDRSAAEMEQ